MKFDDLGLSPKLLDAIKECGYETPTPIQEKAIPPILMTRDVIGLAQTGTGKTASFILPMIEILDGGRARSRMPRSLVLEPTRELAAQVADNFDTYGKHHKLNKALLVGGESLGEQMKVLERGADVLIATPGRLLDLFDRGSILLNDIKVLVIDEADRMLDMGFIPDIEKIISLVPPIRQTLMFSATMPPEIKRIGEKFLSNPKQISVAAPASPAETVNQQIAWVNPRKKNEALDALIQAEDVKNAFIFCNRKKDVDNLAKWLSTRNYAVAAMHGDMPQAKRYETLDRFKEGEITILVCSDVAARGLDVAGLSHVFNYDVPMNADDYVHRIGRTGRAGMQGRAWMLATKAETKFVDAIEKLIKKKIDVGQIENFTSSGSSGESRGESAGDAKDEKGDKDQRRGRRSKYGNRGRTNNRQDDQTPKQQKPREDHNDAPQKPAKKGKEQDNDVVGFGDDVPGFFSK